MSEDWKMAAPGERLFAGHFSVLTDHYPVRWHWRVFEHLVKAEWPHQIDRALGAPACPLRSRGHYPPTRPKESKGGTTQ